MDRNAFEPCDPSVFKSFGDKSWVAKTVAVKHPDGMSIGKHVRIDHGVYITPGKVKLGDYIHIAPYVTIIGGPSSFEMEDFTTIAAQSCIVCGSDEHMGYGLVGPTVPLEFADRQKIEPVIMKRFASITTNSVVLPGVVMAEGSVLGANSFLTKNTEPWTIYVGNPAKPVKVRPRERMIEFARKLGYNVDK